MREFICEKCNTRVREKNIIDLLHKGKMFICKGCITDTLPIIIELQLNKIQDIKLQMDLIIEQVNNENRL